MPGTHAKQIVRGVASSQDGDERKARVFISYAREDLEVAESIRDTLIEAGFDAYLDKHDIAPGEPWKERIGALIAMAEKVVFLVSPDSVASKIAAWEVDQAEAQAKNVVPVLVRDTDADEIPGRLRRLNYIEHREMDDYPQASRSLVEALSIDLAWERKKTRINDRAMAWDRGGRQSGLLTAEQDIRDAEAWRDNRPETSLPPTEIQLAFIRESRVKRTRSQRIRVVVLSVGMIITGGIAIYAWNQRNLAQQQTEIALDREQAARDQQIKAEHRALLTTAQSLLDESTTLAGLVLRELPLDQTSISNDQLYPVARRVAPWEQFMMDAPSVDRTVVWHPTGRAFAALSSLGPPATFWYADGSRAFPVREDSELRVTDLAWNNGGTALLVTLEDGTAEYSDGQSEPQVLAPDDDLGYTGIVGWSTNDRRVVLQGDHKLELWRLDDGDTRVGSRLNEPEGIASAEWSPDEKVVAVGLESGRIRLWQIDSKLNPQYLLHGEGDRVWDVAWSSDSRRLASVGGGELKIWKLEGDSEPIEVSLNASPTQVEWSCDNSALLVSTLATVGIYDSEGSELMKDPDATFASWSPDCDQIVVSDGPKIKILDAEDYNVLTEFENTGSLIEFPYWSPDGLRVATGSADGVRIWLASGPTEPRVMATFNASGLETMAWSPDRTLLAIGRTDGSIDIVDTGDATRTRHLNQPSGHARRLFWRRDQQQLASQSNDGPIHIWNLESGDAPLELGSAHFISDAEWIKDGSLFLSGSRDNTLQVLPLRGDDEPLLFSYDADLVDFSFLPGSPLLRAVWGDARLSEWELEWNPLQATDVRSVPPPDWIDTVTWQVVVTGSGRDTKDENSQVVSHAAWSSDGSQLLLSLGDSRGALWSEPFTQDSRTTFLDDAGSGPVSWRPDGQAFLTSGQDYAKLWELADPSEPVDFTIGSAKVLPSWDAAGVLPITASDDGKIRQWDVSWKSNRERLWEAGGILLPPQRMRYLGEDETKATQRFQDDISYYRALRSARWSGNTLPAPPRSMSDSR